MHILAERVASRLGPGGGGLLSDPLCSRVRSRSPADKVPGEEGRGLLFSFFLRDDAEARKRTDFLVSSLV